MSTGLCNDELVLKVGTNKIELLEFHIDKESDDGTVSQGVYGINVSKVTEVIRMTDITEVPHVPAFLMGIIHLRGKTIPIINLAKWLGITEPKRPMEKNKIIVAEFNNTPLGFVVHQTTKIRRIEWEKISTPPDIMNEKYDGNITGTTMIENDRLLLILDLEKILAELTSNKENSEGALQAAKKKDGARRRILVADDSLVARKQVANILKKANYEVDLVVDGKQAWNRLNELYDATEGKKSSFREVVYLVLSDVEMPEMDGYTLTEKIKDDERFKEIPVILHSSLSGEANTEKGKQVGCDHYVVKFDPEVLFQAINEY
ncbi:MAG: chemotaxis protein CheV [Deltaproteobacteria bacterium]|nr:chemotaxis protein CheV [Deltaproteobacteria bacterium]